MIEKLKVWLAMEKPPIATRLVHVWKWWWGEVRESRGQGKTKTVTEGRRAQALRESLAAIVRTTHLRLPNPNP